MGHKIVGQIFREILKYLREDKMADNSLIRIKEIRGIMEEHGIQE